MDKSLLPPASEQQPQQEAAAERSRWYERVPGGLRTVWIAIGILAVALLIWAIRPSATEQPAGRFGRGGPTLIGVTKVVSGDMPISINALGTVTPLATVTIRPQVSGQLLRFDFTEGQMVGAGDVLAEIDPRPYQAAVDQAKGQLVRDQALLANAKVDLARYQNLAAQNAIAQQQLATQKALVTQDEGTVKSDQANLENAQINLDYCRIRSPAAGRVGLRQVDAGNLVQAGSTTGIVVVTQLQPISVIFSVPEDSIDSIAARMNSGAKLEADAFDRGQTKKLATGALSTIDNQIDTTTGTVKLRATFDNKGNDLFPNQFVNIKLLIDTLHNQVLVPSVAIERGASGAYVFIANADSTVSMRAVTEGPTDGTNVSITSGLKIGETVVVDGADRLRDGAKVQLPGAKPPATDAAPAGTAPDGTTPARHHWDGTTHPGGHGHRHHQDGSTGQPNSQGGTPSQPPPANGQQ